MQRRRTFGGGVSPRNTRLRGQSIIEYVLIAAVIGLVVVFAGPGVAGAIRNQFNLVGNTLNSGTGGDSFMSAEEKAYREAMKTVVNKDAKDWTLDEQKAVAEDIAAKGAASIVYAKAEAAMNAGTKWSVKLTNGKTLEYRIIGIYHDDHADGSGSTGLTFEATNNALDAQRMCTTDNYFNSWEESELRARLNTGDLWALLPSELQSKVEAVTKETNAKDGDEANYPSEVTDKVFLLSTTEVYGNLDSVEFPEGFQYEYYLSRGVTESSYSGASSNGSHWSRSARRENTGYFYYVNNNGSCHFDGNVGYPLYVFPAFCF